MELTAEQIGQPKAQENLSPNLHNYIATFDGALTHEEYNNPRYSYRLLFKKKLVNRPGQADTVVEFIDPNSELAKTIDKEYWVKKEVERAKFLAKHVVAEVRKETSLGDVVHLLTSPWELRYLVRSSHEAHMRGVRVRRGTGHLRSWKGQFLLNAGRRSY